jgi:hypothetical protein
MTILGMRNDENWITNQRPENWRQTMLMLYPNGKLPLTALTGMMKSEAVDDPVFHWFNKNLNDRRLKITEDLDTTETGIDVDNTYNSAFSVKNGDMLLIEQTGEIVRVSADPSANNLITVTRAQAGTGTVANTTGFALTVASSNPFMTVIGSAFEEGSLAPTGVSFDPQESSNYTQIFRSTLEMTRTASKTKLRTGDQVKEAKRECLEIFGIDMERAYWFNGDKKLITINNKPARLTSGVIWQIPALNRIAAPAGGLITMDWIDALMQRIFASGSNEKMGFGGNAILGALQTAVRKNSTYNISPGVKEYGMNVSRLTSPFGELVLKTHPLWNQMTGGTATDGSTYLGMANNLAILDMARVRYRYIDDVTYQKDLTAVGLDGQKSGYLAECGLELQDPSTHFYVTGVTGGDVD